MKKIITVILVLLLTFTMVTGCGNGVPDSVTEIINVATLNGPTGIGMTKLMDQTDKYNITVYQAPTDGVGKMINGEIDIAAVPSNLAATLYNKTGGKVVAISPITMGVLYILGNETYVEDVTDLKGKTIVASGKGGAPEYILQKILKDAGLTIGKDVQVDWLANHTDVNKKLLTQKGTVAMLPEPFVSVAEDNEKADIEELFDLNELWEKSTGESLPMGVLVAQKDFVEERESDLKLFLYDYGLSVDFVNDDEESAKAVVDAGFIGKVEVAEDAIPNCNIVLFENRKEGHSILKKFNEILFEMEPASIGGKLPDEEFYY